MLADSELAQLKLETPSSAIHLKRGGQGICPRDTEHTRLSGDKASRQSLNKNTGSESILSPTVGVFHLLNGPLVYPRPVEAGELLAILHIGVLQRPIRAPMKAMVTGISVTDGETVDYGTVLFQLQPAT
ncbi:hypothetical protein I8J31_13085 [Marinomonas sp. C1424]|uniref:Acetyl-CoA carboxylase biotin carboxyl carrier protein subunit n=1 Tax=Marinomonas transparens TaxID=2795388 RepID=A0A934N356_9GAMM|nr:hypothetical protein [Marinomonas transparens]